VACASHTTSPSASIFLQHVSPPDRRRHATLLHATNLLLDIDDSSVLGNFFSLALPPHLSKTRYHFLYHTSTVYLRRIRPFLVALSTDLSHVSRAGGICEYHNCTWQLKKADNRPEFLGREHVLESDRSLPLNCAATPFQYTTSTLRLDRQESCLDTYLHTLGHIRGVYRVTECKGKYTLISSCRVWLFDAVVTVNQSLASSGHGTVQHASKWEGNDRNTRRQAGDCLQERIDFN
jgi:hypothetical protein